MLKVFSLVLFISLLGCNNVIETTQVEVDKPQIVEEKKPCNFNLEEKLRTYYSPIPGEFRDLERDEKIKEGLQNCPREEIVKLLVNLQKSKNNDIEIQAKTAYFFIKLNHNRTENGKRLISTYSAKNKEVLKSYKDKDYAEKVKRGDFDKEFDLFYLMNLICEMISEDDTNYEFLADAFDLVLLSDGAMSETLSGTLASQFEKTPELFLQKLKPKSNKIKQQTYSFLFYSIQKDKIFQQLASINKDSEVYSLVEEIQKFAKTRKTEN
jgi:hypothetical protein